VALRVHRNTLLGGCVAALLLSIRRWRSCSAKRLSMRWPWNMKTVSSDRGVLAGRGLVWRVKLVARGTAELPRLPELAAFEWQSISQMRQRP
jgi:hypothetical protein